MDTGSYTRVSQSIERACHHIASSAKVGPQRRKKQKTQKSRKSRSSLYRRRFREALTSRHRLRASLLDPRPRRIHRIRQLSQSRLHLLAHERIF